MSFSAETKNELARVISNDDYCNMTELAAIVRLAGSIQIAGYRKLNLNITTELNSVAIKLFKLLKQNFGINTTISVNKNQMLKRNNSYVLIVTSEMGSENLLRELGILEPGDGFYTVNKVPENLLQNEECIRSFIRGAFIGGGSISDPGKNYHMEFVTNNEDFAKSLKD